MKNRPVLKTANLCYFLVLMAAFGMSWNPAFAQTTVFSDDFSTNTNATYTTSGAIGASAWNVAVSGADWGARRNTSPAQLELTNDVGATANVNGWVLASTSAASFSSPYNTTLSSNGGLVTWTFNMRQIRADPAGFTSGSYGVAFVIAGTSTTTNSVGSGYAIVLGQSGAVDPIRLVKYNNGIQGTLTNLITSNTTGLTDFGTEYLSIKVTYAPLTNTWELFLRNDGASAFADPAGGTLVTQGTLVDNTYTGAPLTLMGAYWQGSTAATQTAFYDNVKVTVVQAVFLDVSSPSLAFGSVPAGTNSAGQSVNLTGNGLSPVPGSLTATSSSTHFQVSNDSINWGNTANISYSGSTLSATPLYVRFTPQSEGAKTDSITFTGGGVPSPPKVTVTGTGTLGTPTANAATNINACSFQANWSSVGGATSYRLDVALSNNFYPDNTTVVEWNFPNNPDNNVADAGITDNLAKTIVASGPTGTVTYIPVATSNTSAASVPGWDGGSGSKAWQTEISTSGLNNVKISSAQRSSNTGPRDFKIQYRIGVGGTWTDVPGTTITVANNWTTGVLAATSLPAACDNQPSLFLRWIMTSNFQTDGVSIVASGGTSGIDNVKITGNSVLPGFNNLTVNGTSQVLTGLLAGTNYYYRVRAVGSTTSPSSNIITATTAAFSASATAGTINCNGGTTSVTVTASDGVPPYTGTGTFTVSAGTYTYTVTDNNGCTVSTTVTVAQPAGMTVTATQGAAILCHGNSTTVTVGVSGGSTPYSGTGTFTVNAGAYTYTVTDNNGCSATTSITVNEPAVLDIVVSAGTITCNGGTTTVNVGASGGTSPYSGTDVLTVGSGNYAFTVTDANGCSANTSLAVSQPNAITTSATAGIILCNGGTTSVTVNASGGTGALSGTGHFPVGAGTYTYTVTDASGCTATTGITVNQPTAVTPTASAAPIACHGGTTTVIVGATGGAGNYTGTGSFTVSGGAYSYTVSDVNGCSASTSITVVDPDVLNASATAGAIACHGGTTSVTVSATGGTLPYSGTGSFTVSTGTYSYTVTDGHGCTASTSVSVSQPDVLGASASAGAIACHGGTTSVTVSGSGGTSPYSGTGSFTVSAGAYSYTVTDFNGCTATTGITVSEPDALGASATAGAIACHGGTTSVTVSGSGGTSPYSGTGSFTVSAGAYSYTVTDFHGCTATTAITVSEPDAVGASATAGAIACHGGTTSVTVSGSGGTSPYSGTGSFTVSAGTYNYTVTDFNGCTATTGITVSQPDVLSASASAGSISCHGGTTSVSVSASGGTSSYSGTGNFTVSAGAYSYTVTDFNGCTATTAIVVSQPDALSASATAGVIACHGGTTSVTVSANGGVPSYTGTGTFTVSGGAYNYTVTDGNGCTATTGITVNEPTAVNASATAGAINCNGGTTSVVVSANGGTPGYSGAGSFTVSAGSYTYTVTDLNGCTATTSVVVSEPAALTAMASGGGSVCAGGTVPVTFTFSGAGPYNFSFSNGTSTTNVNNYNSSTYTISNAPTGTYSVVALSNANCTSSSLGSSVSVLVSPVPTLSVVNLNPPCGVTSVNLNTAVTTNAATTNFYTNASFTTLVPNPANVTASGTYFVKATSAIGCTSTASFSVIFKVSPTVSVTNLSVCGNTANLNNAVTATTNQASRSFYTNANALVPDPTAVTTAGTYKVVVTSAGGCTASATFTLTFSNTAPTVSVQNLTPTCGSVNLNTAITGSSNVATTNFYTNAGLTTLVPNPAAVNTAGTYYVKVSSAGGCTASASFTVVYNEVVPPTITCPANITVGAAANTCNGAATVPQPAASDNCSSVSVINSFNSTNNASGTYPVGTTTVTWTATDGAGNTATCAMTVKVVDNRIPNITCPANQTRVGNPATVVLPAPTGMTDNCGIDHWEARYKIGTTWIPWVAASNPTTGPSPIDGAYSPGAYTVQYQAFDVNGNLKICQFSLTVSASLQGMTDDDGVATTDKADAREADVQDLSLKCYPNPFADEVNIGFSLASGADVRLTVTDMMGGEISVLANHWLRHGDYIFQFSAEDYPTGVYFVRLQVGQQIRIAKVVKL